MVYNGFEAPTSKHVPKGAFYEAGYLTIRSSAIPSLDEWAELAWVYEYQDATRKFSSYDLLKF